MKLGIISIAALAFGLSSFSAYAYNPTQVEQFVKTNQCEGCDLSNADFRNKHDFNHSGARLDNANLSGIYSVKFNLSGASLRQANLSGANLDEANLSSADLTGANLSGAWIQYANLFGAIGANLTNARICSSTLPDGTNTVECGQPSRK